MLNTERSAAARELERNYPGGGPNPFSAHLLNKKASMGKSVAGQSSELSIDTSISTAPIEKRPKGEENVAAIQSKDNLEYLSNMSSVRSV